MQFMRGKFNGKWRFQMGRNVQNLILDSNIKHIFRGGLFRVRNKVILRFNADRQGHSFKQVGLREHGAVAEKSA